MPVWTASCNESCVMVTYLFSHQLHLNFLLRSCMCRQWANISQFVTNIRSQSVHLCERSPPEWMRLWWSRTCTALTNVALHIWKKKTEFMNCFSQDREAVNLTHRTLERTLLFRMCCNMALQRNLWLEKSFAYRTRQRRVIYTEVFVQFIRCCR